VTIAVVDPTQRSKIEDNNAHGGPLSVSNLTDRSNEELHENLSRRVFCRAGISAAALISTSGLPLVAQDGKPVTPAKQTPPPATDKDKAVEPASTNAKVKPTQPAAEADQVKSRQLFVPEQFPKGWFFYGGKAGLKLESTWKTVKDVATGKTILQCLGKPYGYIRTLEVFDNYEFGLKWRFPVDPNGNSGILLHTEDDRIWPKSIQVQLHRPKAGSVFPSGEAKSDNQLAVKDLSKPLNQWNECVIRCIDNKISLEINKKKVGEVTGCKPSKGKIALQSEGSEVHFQQIWVRKLS
jgi:hypothetical protein